MSDEKIDGRLDVLWGAAAIGAVIGKSAKATFHMLERRKIPGKKIGGRWCARRADLERAFTDDAA